VGVDDAGSHHQSLGVDHPVRRLAVEPPHRHHPAAGHGHVGRARGGAFVDLLGLSGRRRSVATNDQGSTR
jgi:hypothetical protein